MRISIEYNSSWRNSFLGGSNNEKLPKKGRKYIGSGASLNSGKGTNYIKREVTQDTVMGLLNYLIGDKRKLYQARNKQYADTYYFEDIESKVSFTDSPIISEEIVYLRNFNGNYNPSSFTGAVKANDKAFTSEYSSALWGICELTFEELCSFIVNKDEVKSSKKYDPREICTIFEKLGKEKVKENEGEVTKALKVFKKHFPEATYENAKGKIYPAMMYCSALYLQRERLGKKYDVSACTAPRGGIPGVSKRNFTLSDFMKYFTTGKAKKLWGNPYIMKQKIKGQGEVVSRLNKADGILEITLDIDESKATELIEMIDNAGQSSFYVGKKGLAYVTKIRRN